ncbi:hypothetical protein CCACVL1_25851 [Corchorus capsularis]|uniref:Uncharacterized protein n=1 Tax=Corchorus capsularis TaxID=210143 RepID=A0A1R3GGT9_COCAP|nr:hypothetical protein CCACVL1_25851 [Corchorus capsularis]
MAFPTTREGTQAAATRKKQSRKPSPAATGLAASNDGNNCCDGSEHDNRWRTRGEPYHGGERQIQATTSTIEKKKKGDAMQWERKGRVRKAALELGG